MASGISSNAPHKLQAAPAAIWPRFSYSPGDTIENEVFTRSTPATYFDAAGILRTSRANAVIDSSGFTVGWTIIGGVTSWADDPIPGFGWPSRVMTSPGMAGNAGWSQNGSAPVGVDTNTHICSWWIKKDAISSREPRLGFAMSNTGAWTRYIQFRTDTGAYTDVTNTATSTVTVTDEGNGYWRVDMTITNDGTRTFLVYSIQPNYGGAGPVAPVTVGHVQVEVNRSTYSGSMVHGYTTFGYEKRDAHYVGGVRYLLTETSFSIHTLWNRDFTNAVWNKTSMTATKDQTGIDGVANSASRLTATGANATVIQNVTSASSTRLLHLYVKRITGAGTIQVTSDNGATWTTIAVTGAWARVTGLAQTLTNPQCGIRIVTNGDEIAVDYFSLEVFASVPSSAVETTTAFVTRAADQYYAPWKWAPQPMTIYGVWNQPFFFGALVAIGAGAFQNINSSGSWPYLRIYGIPNGGGRWTNAMRTTREISENQPQANFTMNVPIEILSQVLAEGTIVGWHNQGAGDVLVMPWGSALPLTRTLGIGIWSEPYIVIGAASFVNGGISQISKLVIASGINSFDMMRNMS